MARRTMWISMAAVIAVAALAQPWRGGEAEARPAPKAAACTAGELARVKAELAATKAELAEAKLEAQRQRDVVQYLIAAETRRTRMLEAQLGSPMIETLKGTDLH